MVGLVTAILLAGAGAGWLTVRLQREVVQLRAGLKRIDSESFRIADQFSELLRQLNDSLYRSGASHVSPDVAAFNQTIRELDTWIDVQKPKVTSAQEREVMEQIDHAYDDYMRVARELLGRLETVGEASATMDEYTALRREAQRLFQLGQALGRAHLASRDQVLASVDVASMRLRGLVLALLGLLFLFSLALGFLVYREKILPLRMRLVESENLRERQEKLASLGVLAAGVAHEIRNPLTAIKGVVFLQQKELARGSKQYADAKIVEREILRLERIVNDFLLFSRPGDCKLTALAADQPLREVHALMESELARKGTQLVLEGVGPFPIKADPEQLKQVLINLVRNAAEAIEHEGVVKLSARLDRRPLAGKETKVVVLDIEDNGKGMSLETQKRLFDPFFTTKDTGTGLGLSIAARIVQSHGGVIEYQTAPGLGTTFGIVLPVVNHQTDSSAD
jgi:signal transduction histidine kinase